MIEEKDFLKLFKRDREISLKKFLDSYKVKTSNRMYKLREYIELKKINMNDIIFLKGILENKDVYLINFYNRSLKIENNFLHKEIPSRIYNNNLLVKYKNQIRNLHMRDILLNTKSGYIKNQRSYLDMAFDLFNKKTIDYQILAPASLYYIKKGGFGGVLSSLYFRASIMNPYLVYSLNLTLLQGTKVFTPTLGWTSYMYGLLETQIVREYVGTDVIKEVCDKTKEFAKNYPKITTKIYNKPSENLLNYSYFKKNYKNHFDLVFFSPPYFKLELYDSENQSTDKYKTYDEWLEKYWEKTIELCYFVLEKGGRLCYILSGYGSDNTEKYNLINDMNNITEKKFELIAIKNMFNKNVNVTQHRETGEKIMIFTK